MKNIPQSGREEYIMNFTHRIRNLVTGMTWHAIFVLGMAKPGQSKETYGFNSLEQPDNLPIMEPFKERLANDLVGNIKWKNNTYKSNIMN